MLDWEIDKLKCERFKVGSDGFVKLIDVMGDDAAIVQAARVSYGRGVDTCDKCKGVGCTECGHTGYDLAKANHLIRYLMRHRHTTPFEMAEIKMLIRIPMDIWRQGVRHRTANINEYSTRYTEAIDCAATTDPDKWRSQSSTNKQGSGEFITEWPDNWRIENNDDAEPEVGAPATCNLICEGPGYKYTHHRAGPADMTPGEYLRIREDDLQQHARAVYEERLRLGVAREQARKDLPLSTYTELYWKFDLHNLLHFLSLRMDSHAQLEIREFAETIGYKIVKPLFPLTWKAFEDYRLNTLTLTGEDLKVITFMNNDLSFKQAMVQMGWTPKTREARECKGKLVRIGMLAPFDYPEVEEIR